MSFEKRFWPRVDRRDDDDCWPWRGPPTVYGYGQIRNPAVGRPVHAHRVAYELLVGPVPAGLDLDHVCRFRLCVNPAHLEPVTREENFRRGAGRGQALWVAPTHCKRDHAFTPENTYVIPSSGSRQCRACVALLKGGVNQ